ncbi:MAG: esterase-like activity of phytase family protein [Acidobacteria bacterium]|nr:esterase-like activity of phytase family protein [Acidobacteriota bacterium]
MTRRPWLERRQRTHVRLAAGLVAAALTLLGCAASGLLAPAAPRPQIPGPMSTPSPATAPVGAPVAFQGFDLLGEAVISARLTIAGVPVGGLSGITYDAELDLYYAISDDPASKGPARFYTLDIDLSGASLDSTDVEVVAVTELRDRNGAPFVEMTLDLEAIALTPERTLYVSSEGQADQGVGPFLREYELDGSYLRDLPVPRKFRPRAGERTGIRHNLGFESVALDARRNYFYTATENALWQDGPAADVGVASPSRILRLDRTSGRPMAEYVYMVEPVGDAPPGIDDFRTRGLVDLLALDDSHLLTLERAYTQGVGNVVELFLVSLEGATDVRRWKSLEGKSYRPVTKTSVLPLEALGLELDNLEGLTFGPRLPDGRRSLVLVADNNFSPRQRNQILAFALEERQLTPSLIQGSGHRSPLEGAWVREVPGTVTSPAARGRGFWMQGAGDRDDTTSDALFVLPAGEADASPGDVVLVDGLVRETGFPGGLTVTSLEDARFVIVERGARLPSPVVIATSAAGGTSGARVLPRQIDDDGLEIFEPTDDAIDFFESLEGMRVAISSPTVVGPTTRFGEFAVVGDDLTGDDVIRSPTGGLVASSAATYPQPFLVVPRPGTEAPEVAVGDRLDDSITGVIDYAFGTFRILGGVLPEPTAALHPPPRTAAAAATPTTDHALLIATYNVENLSGRSGPEKYQRLARSITGPLGSPDIVALQEIQDDTGPEDDGTVSAEQTLARLAEAIEAAGGPRYEHLSIDPEDRADGGRPGANIRVAYLYRPERVRFVPRGTAQADTAAEWLVDERGPFLSPNPARVNPKHPAFAADPDRNQGGSRKPLAAEFEFKGRRLFMVNVHLRSKRGDSPIFGASQPPVRPTQELRSAEALVIRDFLDRLLALDPDAAAIVLGDFNEHPYREPVALFADSGLTNLVERVPQDRRYTFIFRGTAQVLDNVLVTGSLARDSVATVEIVHLNSDLPDSVRAADHDPIVVRLEW